jgi:hypothetical protein
VYDADGTLEPTGAIRLEQCGAKVFRLHSTVRFEAGSPTGLEGRLPDEAVEAIRTVTPQQLSETDLASVPAPLQWLVWRYGVYTPAALVHDRLIGRGSPRGGIFENMRDEYADRYFRFMLEALGVKWLRRWMMWAAVALRTRWCAGTKQKALLALWIVAAMAGIVSAVVGVVIQDWLVVGLASAAPLLFSLLWERQYGAGLVASYTALWVLPPTVLGALGYGIYFAIEAFAGLFRRGKGEHHTAI